MSRQVALMESVEARTLLSASDNGIVIETVRHVYAAADFDYTDANKIETSASITTDITVYSVIANGVTTNTVSVTASDVLTRYDLGRLINVTSSFGSKDITFVTRKAGGWFEFQQPGTSVKISPDLSEAHLHTTWVSADSVSGKYIPLKVDLDWKATAPRQVETSSSQFVGEGVRLLGASVDVQRPALARGSIVASTPNSQLGTEVNFSPSKSYVATIGGGVSVTVTIPLAAPAKVVAPVVQSAWSRLQEAIV